MNKLAIASSLALALAAGGCFKSTIHLQPGPGTPGAVNGAFHIGLIGIIELSAPVNLQTACAGGQAVAIDEEVNFIGGLVNEVLSNIIGPIFYIINPTVECGAGGAAPPPAGGPPPAEGGPAGM